MNHNKFDVIIIGAGPAGSRSAKVLGEKGLSVLMLDRMKFPREKACGGLLTKKTLDLLGISQESFLTENLINKIDIYSHNFRKVSWADNHTLGITARRERFDQYLVEQAIKTNVEFKDGVKILNIEPKENEIIVYSQNQSYKSTYVIAADGALSTTALRLGLRPHFFFMKMGFTLSTIIEGTVYDQNNTVDLYFVPFLGGFGWFFPLGQYVNMGIGSSFFGRNKLFPYFDNFVKQMTQRKKMELAKVKTRGCFLPAGGFRRKLGKGNVLLAGDAAGTVDTFTGEGIYHAVLTGQMAAESIWRSMTNKNKEKALTIYQESFNEKLSNELRYSLALSIISYKKNELQFEMLQHNPLMMKWVADLMKMDNCYRELFLDNILHFPQYTLRTILQR